MTTHQKQQPLLAGAPLAEATVALILVHGRGASPEGIVALGELVAPPDAALYAPRAAGGTWYPYSFMAPFDDNQPGLDSALQALAEALVHIDAIGIPAARTVLMGFSQGACLALEFAARNPRRYGGIVGLSGGLIGPPGTPRGYEGTLEGTPTFVGCSDIDPHVPIERFRETADVMRRIGGEVTDRVYAGMGHTVNDDEIGFARAIVTAAGSPARGSEK